MLDGITQMKDRLFWPAQIFLFLLETKYAISESHSVPYKLMKPSSSKMAEFLLEKQSYYFILFYFTRQCQII